MRYFEVKHGPIHVGYVKAVDMTQARREMRRIARERRYVWLALWQSPQSSNTHLVELGGAR